MVILTDEQIQGLLAAPKTMVSNKIKWVIQKKSQQCEVEFESTGYIAHTLILYIRQSMIDDDSFSCGLRLQIKGQESITLTRYNGSSHDHTNTIERQYIDFKCHIHYATERYQLAGKKIDCYAEETDRYENLKGAIKCLIADCAINGLQLEHIMQQGGLFNEH